MCVAFMPMHLVVLECKKVSKMRLGAVQTFREFSGFFWNLFSFFLSYFYLLEGSKILFHEPQMLYLDFSYPNLPLGIFLEFL
jgi:hypothetical protein